MADASESGRNTTSRRGGRRGVLVAVLVVAVVVVAYLVWAASTVHAARQDVAAGIDAVSAARDQLDPADPAAEEPLDGIREGRARFGAAAEATGSPALAPLRVAPVVGRQLTSVHRLSTAAAEVTEVVLDLHAAVVPALDVLDAGDDGGEARVRVLREVAGAAEEAGDRLERLDYGPEDGLVGELAEGRADLVAAVADARDGLRRGASGARAGADLLAGPGRYLVLAANNAEMRAGAGMLLSVGVLETRDGAVALVEPMRSVTEVAVPDGAATPAGDLAERWGWLRAEDFRNLMVSPHFPASAERAAGMWAAAGGGPVDGVLVFDPVALEGIVAATGPVVVDGREVGSDDLLAELLVEQYLRFADEGADARRDELGGVVGAVLDRFDAGDWDAAVMVRELATAVRGRHLLAWSSRPELAEAFALAGVDGRLRGDAVLVSVLNFGGNKLDRFLEVEADLIVTPGSDGVEVAVEVSMRNRAPEGLPAYVAGPHPMTGVGAGDYLGFLSITIPGSSTGGRYDGDPPLVAAGPDHGTKVVAARVEVPRGGETAMTVRFRLAAGVRELVVAPSARVPPVRWRHDGTTWVDAESRRVRW